MARKKVDQSARFVPRPLPTEVEQISRYSRVRYTVAVWWPEGYGGNKSFVTLADANKYAAELKGQGYPKYRRSQVHIFRDSLELLGVLEAPEPQDDNQETN